MKKTKAPPSRLGPYKMVFSEDLQIEQIVWLDAPPLPSDASPGAEREAARDLHKPEEQLLVDVHRENNTKRLASMMLRVVKSNERLSRVILFLTIVAVVLAGIQTIAIWPTRLGLAAVVGWVFALIRLDRRLSEQMHADRRGGWKASI